MKFSNARDRIWLFYFVPIRLNFFGWTFIKLLEQSKRLYCTTHSVCLSSSILWHDGSLERPWNRMTLKMLLNSTHLGMLIFWIEWKTYSSGKNLDGIFSYNFPLKLLPHWNWIPFLIAFCEVGISFETVRIFLTWMSKLLKRIQMEYPICCIHGPVAFKNSVSTTKRSVWYVGWYEISSNFT